MSGMVVEYFFLRLGCLTMNDRKNLATLLVALENIYQRRLQALDAAGIHTYSLPMDEVHFGHRDYKSRQKYTLGRAVDINFCHHY